MQIKIGFALMQRVEYPFNQILPAGSNDKNDRRLALLILNFSHLVPTYLANEQLL